MKYFYLFILGTHRSLLPLLFDDPLFYGLSTSLNGEGPNKYGDDVEAGLDLGVS